MTEITFVKPDPLLGPTVPFLGVILLYYSTQQKQWSSVSGDVTLLNVAAGHHEVLTL